MINEEAVKFVIKKSLPRMLAKNKKESHTDYKTEIPTPDDLKILAELKKYPSLYNAINEQPEYMLGKIYKVITAFYS